ncbi:putative esterase [hydrothermal vent metagenome]|uniref:Putative esterase n=1 Tax=hydrothermal vent metagenome TaxID=652676 RepID=A0A3B0V8J7_9ZZZZ
MTKLKKQHYFGLFILFGLFTAVFITISQPVQAGFVQNEGNYWNRGNLTLPSNGDGNIEHCTVESSNLKTPNNVVGFNVYTPPSYSSGSQSYPVVYLLHGLNGQEYNYFSYFSNSTFFNSGSGSLPSLIDNGLADEAIIVFVNGGAQSFYNDWSDSTTYGPSSSFPIQSESVIMEDVIPFVDANFRTVPNRNGRAVEGFSMGGRGAIKLAFNNPDQFCSAISYAGAAYEEIPGSAVGNPYIGPHEPSNTISTITANNAATIQANGLQIRLVDGVNDGAAGQGGGSPTLSSQLTDLGIPHEFVASQSDVNGHNWAQYHQATGNEGLDFHFSCFAAAKSSIPASGILGGADIFSYLPYVTTSDQVPVPTPTPSPNPGSCN